MSSFADLVAIGDESPEQVPFPAMPGVVFAIRPAGRAYSQAIADAQLRHQVKTGAALTGDEASKAYASIDAQYLLAGWSGIEDIPFSPEKARELIWRSFPVQQFVRAQAARIANRRSGVVEELVGNSESMPDELFAPGS